MSNIFVISDTHFDHKNILTSKRPDGTPLRDFHFIQEMNEHIIEKWNSVVRVQDKVYHLGDVTMAKTLPDDILFRLNGHKRLVKGNHDIAPMKAYLEHFDEVYSCRVLDKMILTHIPIHPESLGRFGANIHGHIHAQKEFDDRYFNASCEAIDYTPISLEQIKAKLKKRGL